ncbi:MAG: hypothetical protein Q9162_007153 [Coniocarpon cinnabarinum]
MVSVETLKMEDRKRPALDDDSRSAPPLKKQATSTNSNSQHPDADMPWKDDIEAFQKDALFRRLKEHQREAKTAKDDLESVRKHAQYHDDHLRVIDGWFSQLLDEVVLVCNNDESAEETPAFTPFESSLFTSSTERFEEHLAKKSDDIRAAIKRIFSRRSQTDPETSKLQTRIAELLAAEKKHVVELQGLDSQVNLLEERLENASMRYMMAEKKLDRLKSQPVQKLEAQAKQPPKMDEDDMSPSAIKAEEKRLVNGVSTEASAEVEAAKREALASKDKTKETLNKLEEENRRLLDDLTAARSKSVTLSDEDYSHTELYKTLKAQHEDVIKRVNDLQAVHTQLRAEIKQLHAERTSYKEEMEKEQETAIKDSESQVTRLGLDLQRIRNERDNALQDLAVTQAQRKENTESEARNAELSTAKDSRITSLESEVERLNQAAEGKPPDDAEDPSDLDTDALRAKVQSVLSENKMLMQELSAMEKSYKRAVAAGSQKLSNAADLEKRLSLVNAEKEKANQKYFQTEKAKQAQSAELRALRQQQTKTTELVSQHKEAETHRRSFTVQLEKQIADLKDSLAHVEKNHRDIQQREYDFKTKSERLTTQVAELQKQLTAKDETVKTSQQSSRHCEIETAELKVRLEETQKSLETWKKRSTGAKNEEYEMLKQIATCTICRKNFKDIALKACGHVFCQTCIDERYNNRARKCPICVAPFGQNDRIKVTL